jgi:hypothetical protein
MNSRPTPAERLGNADAFLSRGDLRELGLERRAVDAVLVLDGYSRPLLKVADYLAYLERCTHDGRTRVR